LQSRPWIQNVLRTSTHPVRSRTQSDGVVRCRFVFKVGGSNSPTQNPAYSPPSAHLIKKGITFLGRYSDEELLLIRDFLRVARTLITEYADALREKRPVAEQISLVQLAPKRSRHAVVTGDPFMSTRSLSSLLFIWHRSSRAGTDLLH